MKDYINGILIKEKQFHGVDGEFWKMKVSVNIYEFFHCLLKQKSEDAEILQLLEQRMQQAPLWFNGEIIKRKEPSEKGITHYMAVDTYVPPAKQAEEVEQVADDEINLDEIPF